jgi:V8-like Glu-specific endopeptidase
MANRQHIVAQARRILGTADKAAEAARHAERARRAPANTGGLESLEATKAPPSESTPVTRAIAEERAQRIEDGLDAMRKIESGREAEITEQGQRGLEAIILLTGRPAILIQGGDFMEPPAQWAELKPLRSNIQSVIQRVGRIEVANNPNFDWLGTGFLAGADTVITNRHVAQEFAQSTTPGKWTFRAPMTAGIDFKSEFGSTDALEFSLQEIIGIHDTHDMAVLRVAKTSGATALADPLPVAAKAPGNALVGRKVYVIGYPAWDGRRNDPEPMRRIFSEIYNVKRLQPGEISGATVQAFEIFHDCSTLGGNSGSPVIDLETHRVLGLHFGGRYMEKNHAIPLWTLQSDPLIQKAKLNFQ